jgi:hypothetical protein
MRRCGPRDVHDEGVRVETFEAQSHGFGTHCLRFAGRVTPPPRKTRFRPLARRYRIGLITYRAAIEGFRSHVMLFLLLLQASWRKDILLFSSLNLRLPFGRI